MIIEKKMLSTLYRSFQELKFPSKKKRALLGTLKKSSGLIARCVPCGLSGHLMKRKRETVHPH
ncbi:hypothetical protein BDC45DRAFT_499579 [Circinella umbellata]|nr:hypothetical protein BDC45DRAFT_499579 [Circinella umbellata]